MFFPDPAALACCAATCACGIGSACAYRHRAQLPHPSECTWIGFCMRRLGCHDHDKFDMLVEVHDVLNLLTTGQAAVEIQAGRFSARTSPAEVIKTRAEIQERLTLHVRQCERVIYVRVLRQGVVGTEKIGECEIKVKSDLIDVGFPKRQSYAMMSEGKVSCKVVLSFHRLDTSHVNLGEYQMSPLIHQALLHAQYEAESRGESLKIDINNMSDLQRLRFFSKVLEGPLKLMSSVGGSWIPLYFKATERRSGKWEWQYWNSKEECLTGEKKKGGYSFLAISLVLPDKYDRNTFYVRYHNHQGVHDLFFRRVDRDRNLWSNGLYEFIEKLREYLEKAPDLPAAEAYLEKKRQMEEEEGDRQRRSSARNGRKNSSRGGTAAAAGRSKTLDHLSDIKRIASPRQTAATEQERPRVAQLKRRMVEGLMMESVSDDDSNSEEQQQISAMGSLATRSYSTGEQLQKETSKTSIQ
ncbi:hypothetical protein, conserved [Eimeria brunetti]|uniref:CERLI1-like PH domain-containing protein n=1 Tax=Eimeria brunetti TaxID=51314 RepID=U6LLY3_9EIME|nr:hypothetical protein, conserved [Eimeria brunetti]